MKRAEKVLEYLGWVGKAIVKRNKIITTYKNVEDYRHRLKGWGITDSAFVGIWGYTISWINPADELEVMVLNKEIENERRKTNR